MSDTLTAALIGFAAALLAGVVTGAYTVGGWSAFQRRVIKQELDILASLESRTLQRRELATLVQARLTSYVVRQRLPVARAVEDRWTGRVLIWGALATVGSMAYFAFEPVLSASPRSLSQFTLVVAGAATFLSALVAGGCLGISVGHEVRNGIARRRWGIYELDSDRLATIAQEARPPEDTHLLADWYRHRFGPTPTDWWRGRHGADRRDDEE